MSFFYVRNETLKMAIKNYFEDILNPEERIASAPCKHQRKIELASKISLLQSNHFLLSKVFQGFFKQSFT